MKNHLENRCPPSRVQRAKYDQIVAIVTANPGISLGQISRQYYGDKYSRDKDRRMTSMVLQLCYDNRIKYQEVNRYVPVEPLCAN